MPQSTTIITICVCHYSWVRKRKVLINQMFLLGKKGSRSSADVFELNQTTTKCSIEIVNFQIPTECYRCYRFSTRWKVITPSLDDSESLLQFHRMLRSSLIMAIQHYCPYFCTGCGWKGKDWSVANHEFPPCSNKYLPYMVPELPQ